MIIFLEVFLTKTFDILYYEVPDDCKFNYSRSKRYKSKIGYSVAPTQEKLRLSAPTEVLFAQRAFVIVLSHQRFLSDLPPKSGA